MLLKLLHKISSTFLGNRQKKSGTRKFAITHPLARKKTSESEDEEITVISRALSLSHTHSQNIRLGKTSSSILRPLTIKFGASLGILKLFIRSAVRIFFSFFLFNRTAKIPPLVENLSEHQTYSRRMLELGEKNIRFNSSSSKTRN